MYVVSLGRVGNTGIPSNTPYQPWWTDEFSDSESAHPEGGQSIAPSTPVWGDFTAHLFFQGVAPASYVDVSFVRTLKDGSPHDVPAGPFRFYPDSRGRVEAQVSAKFKLDATKRARVQIISSDPMMITLAESSTFKTYLFKD